MYKVRAVSVPCRSHRIYLPKFVERDTLKSYSTMKTLKYLTPYIYPSDSGLRNIVFTTTGLLLAAKSLNAYVPFILKEGIDSISLSPSHFLYSGGIFLAYSLSRALVIGLQEYRVALFSKVTANAMKEVSSKLFSHLHTLDYTFHQQSTRTTLYSVDRSIKGIENFFRLASLYIIPTIVEFCLASGVIYYSCGAPYLMTLASTVTVYYMFTTKYSNIRQKFIRENKAKSKAVDFVINESILNFEIVKYFSGENREKERYNYFLNQKLEGSQKITVSLSKLNFGQQMIFNTGLGINLLLAVHQVMNNTMTIGDIFMIQSLFMSLQMPLHFLGTIYREMNEAQIEINELFQLLEVKSKVIEKPDAKDYEYKGGEIVVEGIKFTPGKTIFNGVDMVIKAGSSNAFIGESGAGKSSLFRLIYRLIDPEEGRILIDGQDLKDLTISSLRQNIAIVPQNPVLFNDTIYYNVTYGCPSATEEQVEKACKLANIHNRIMQFPDAYQSLVGELGNKLSGGEKQRLALARCLLMDAKIFLLDEFTSAMDSANEQEILASMTHLFKGKTVIYNSHRLSSITFVDKIFVIDDGKICETGTHQELIAKENSKYLGLWNKFISTKGNN